MVTVYDPVGYPINLMYGQSMVPVKKGAIPRPIVMNYEDRKERLNAFQRCTQGPAAVHKVRCPQSDRLLNTDSCSLVITGFVTQTSTRLMTSGYVHSTWCLRMWSTPHRRREMRRPTSLHFSISISARSTRITIPFSWAPRRDNEFITALLKSMTLIPSSSVTSE